MLLFSTVNNTIFWAEAPRWDEVRRIDTDMRARTSFGEDFVYSVCIGSAWFSWGILRTV